MTKEQLARANKITEDLNSLDNSLNQYDNKVNNFIDIRKTSMPNLRKLLENAIEVLKKELEDL